MTNYLMSLNGGPMVVQISVDEIVTPIYQHDDGHNFVAVRPGAKVAVLVRNRSIDGTRIEVLMSVDGRNVLVDEAATFQNGGMVVSHAQTWTNRGWRIDSQTVKPFVFTQNVLETIAFQATGSTSRLGVIGVAVFEEAVMRSQVRPTSSPEAFRGAKGGMGMGEQPIYDPVGTTTFRRFTLSPRAVLEIQYRTPEALRAMGIVLIDDDPPENYPPAFGGPGYGGYRPTR